MNTKKLTPLDSKHLTGQAIIFSLTALLLLGIVGIKFSGIGQRGAGGLETAEAAQTFVPDPNSPIGRGEHPRLYISPTTLPTMANRAIGSHSAMYNAIKIRADALLVEPIRFYSGDYAVPVFDQAATLSLVAMIEKQNGNPYIEYRDRAFAYAQYILDHVDPWDLSSKYTGSSYNIRGRCGALSLVYDWLYEELDPALKTGIHTFLINVYKGVHNIDRPSGAGVERKSVYGSNYWLEWGAYMWFSVALYGDGEGDDSLIIDALSDTQVEVNDYMIPALNVLGGALHNGWGYQLSGGDMSFAVLNLLAWQTASNEIVFDQTFALKDYAQYWLYARKPDNTLIKIDDTHDAYSSSMINAIDQWGQPAARSVLLPLLFAFKDGYSKYIVDLKDFVYNQNEQWRNLLFYEDSVPSADPTSLDLVKFFSGTGILFGRNGWGVDDLFYIFRNRDQYGNHADAKQNSFTIFYKGSPLAINDGNYPAGASSQPSTKSYYRRTISSNSILVFDPDERFRQFGEELYNDGGQKYGDTSEGASGYTLGYSDLYYNQSEHDASEYNTADNIYEDSSDYTWIKGDATRGYSNGKVGNFTRQFVHFKPDYFVIFDRVSPVDANFKKKWLLHSIGEPILNGKEDFTCQADPLAGETACQGDTTAGISKSFDSNLVEITNGDARLFSKTLLPDNSVIRKIGGTGYEFWVDDANQNLAPIYWTSSVTGGWRIEISATENAQDDIFLHVIQTADINTGDNMAVTSRINGDTMVGAHIQDDVQGHRIAMFSKTEANQTQVTYTLPETTKTIKHLIADLATGFTYNIYQDGNLIGTQIVGQTGTLYFTSQGASVFQITQGAANLPPQITSLTATPQSGNAPLTVSFASTASDPDGSITGYSWDFGDGGASIEQNPTHTYNKSDTYIAKLTVTDNSGAQVSDSLTITVTESLQPNIVLTKSADIATAKSGDIITYTIAYQNIGTGEARNIIITDPIPQGTTYVTGSADATAGSFDGT